MSGGPYGRGKAPERACLTVCDWPPADRELWEAALRPEDPFDLATGARARYRDRSNRKVEQGFGRFLTYLRVVERLELGSSATSLITPGLVRAYTAHLEELGNSTQTLLCRLKELYEAGKVLAPDSDWSFITGIESRVRARNVPARDKRAALAPSDELLDLGLALMDGAESESTRRLQAIAYRDGLLIAFLALRPLRRSNVAALEIGGSLVKAGDLWIIAFEPNATKTHAPLTFPFPDILIERLETYLTRWRPILCKLRSRWASEIGQRLWVSCHGSPMTEMAVYDTIRKRTALAFGTAMNPHLFRDAAATTWAVEDPEHVRAASALLGHRSLATTERHYQQAQSLSAHRRFAKAIKGRRG